MRCGGMRFASQKIRSRILIDLLRLTSRHERTLQGCAVSHSTTSLRGGRRSTHPPPPLPPPYALRFPSFSCSPLETAPATFQGSLRTAESREKQERMGLSAGLALHALCAACLIGIVAGRPGLPPPSPLQAASPPPPLPSLASPAASKEQRFKTGRATVYGGHPSSQQNSSGVDASQLACGMVSLTPWAEVGACFGCPPACRTRPPSCWAACRPGVPVANLLRANGIIR